MGSDDPKALDPLAASRQLWGRWLALVSESTDSTMRSPLFLSWMHCGLRALTEARRVQEQALFGALALYGWRQDTDAPAGSESKKI